MLIPCQCLIRIRAAPATTQCNGRMNTTKSDYAVIDDVDVVELDVRDLPAPQPLVRMLEALMALKGAQSLLARTRSAPKALLDRLGAMGYHADVVDSGAGDAWVYIAPEARTSPARAA